MYTLALRPAKQEISFLGRSEFTQEVSYKVQILKCADLKISMY